ncbi:MAG TPA: cation diffusion facilitator family transporter, partial [Spirochaetota bacterium]
MKRLPYTSPVRFIYLSIAASVTTLLLKGIAYYLTGSIGLLSDALESIINLAAAIMALILITIASSPPDKNHPFGHGKAEYFSSVIEGTLILCAAIAIGVTSVERIINPHELQKLGSGLIISGIASLINLLTGVTLVRKGRLHRSITLEADGRHLLTDVWTTAGVLVALLIVKLTGLTILDPL